ncbi:uncharacterized protein LOC143323433 [Chaetodon auriga]|uniref:uncharacterized protein LOC143323433 n=1 Tax=Chaetodon auriga TaxID=39042 RepID=UPI004032B6EB
MVTLYETLAMNADRLILLLALRFVCVSSNDEENFDNKSCETQTLSAPLGSSVLLPCVFSTSSLNLVSWSQTPDMDLVHLTSEGRVKFVDPRYGRVKAFPNQGLEGNYSICIDELKNSDLGCYRCEQGEDCLQVKLVAAEIGKLSGELLLLLIYICVGLAVCILLIVCGCCCCVKFRSWWNDRTQDHADKDVGAGASAPPLETGRVPAEQQRGQDTLVYENDDQDPANQQGDPFRNRCSLPGVLPDLDGTRPTQDTSGIYPNLSQFNFERMQSQRRKLRFHAELFSRLRQASLSRHYYVNQGDISRQQAAPTQAENPPRAGVGKKRARENCEYKNPIYNRSTDQLNQL